MVSGKIGKFRVDVMVELFEVGYHLVVGLDHLCEHDDCLPGPLVLSVLSRLIMPDHGALEAVQGDVDEDVVCEIVILAPAVVHLAGEDLLPLNELEVVDNCLGRDHQRLRYFGDKAGLLPQEADDAAPVPVPEDIEQPGEFCEILHVHFMLVMQMYKESYRGFWCVVVTSWLRTRHGAWRDFLRDRTLSPRLARDFEIVTQPIVEDGCTNSVYPGEIISEVF